ncbi:hypothetical protein WCN70_14140, partial [Staphylococcus aureus]
MKRQKKKRQKLKHNKLQLQNNHLNKSNEPYVIIDHADDEATKEEEAEAEAQQVAAAEQSSKQI